MLPMSLPSLGISSVSASFFLSAFLGLKIVQIAYLHGESSLLVTLNTPAGLC